LVIERIAGKDFTTLRAIREMRERCRKEVKVLGFGSNPPVGASMRHGSSETANLSGAQASARMKLEKLSRL
jgi:hypothetical protein